MHLMWSVNYLDWIDLLLSDNLLLLLRFGEDGGGFAFDDDNDVGASHASRPEKLVELPTPPPTGPRPTHSAVSQSSSESHTKATHCSHKTETFTGNRFVAFLSQIKILQKPFGFHKQNHRPFAIRRQSGKGLSHYVTSAIQNDSWINPPQRDCRRLIPKSFSPKKKAEYVLH